ncbi:GNAT family N-acetyltransferase [Vulcanococcus limneticus]|uniref:GNAT family N-acetyltransferase n=1 Tax=Vulcanococcus limneticus TaxID=2170428 RepID=UPI00398BDC9E
MSAVEYHRDVPLDPVDVIRVFNASGIRRPTFDADRIARMFSAPCLIVSAWLDGHLVGVCRSLTDFAYCCYLPDLAVDKSVQGQGIGTQLIRQTQAAIGDEVSLVLLSAPSAMSYYPQAGFEIAENAFIINRQR